MTTRSLFDEEPEPPSQRHSPTSVAAGASVAPVTGELRRRVHAYLVEHGERGATDEEGIAALGLSPSTYRPRRIELVTAGRVVDSGRRRKTQSGRAAVVWMVSEVAKPTIQEG